ncbi:MAG: hypothetical protein F2839_02250, partial [Actinobacteria bacterium]|nr:hypothetical protein [Actinomycetota bacterium]
MKSMKKQISITTIASLLLSVLIGAATAPAAQAIAPKKLSALVVDNLNGYAGDLDGSVSRLNPVFNADIKDYAVVTGDYSVSVAATIDSPGNANLITFKIDGKSPVKVIDSDWDCSGDPCVYIPMSQQALTPVVSGDTATQELELSPGIHDVEIDVDGNVYHLSIGYLAVQQPEITAVSETSGPLWANNLVDFRMRNVPYLGFGPDAPDNYPWVSGTPGTNTHWKQSACTIYAAVSADSTFTNSDLGLQAPVQGSRQDAATGDTIVTLVMPAGVELGSVSVGFTVTCEIITDWDDTADPTDPWYATTFRYSLNVSKDVYTYVATPTTGITAQIPAAVTLGSGITLNGPGLSHYAFEDPKSNTTDWMQDEDSSLRAYLVDPNHIPDSMSYEDWCGESCYAWTPIRTGDDTFGQDTGEPWSGAVPFIELRSWGYANDSTTQLYVPKDPFRSFGEDKSEIFFEPSKLQLMVVKCSFYANNDFNDNDELAANSDYCQWSTPVYSSEVNWSGMAAQNITVSPQSSGLNGSGEWKNDHIKNGVTIRGRNLFTDTDWADSLSATQSQKTVTRGPNAGKLISTKPSAAKMAKIKAKVAAKSTSRKLSGTTAPKRNIEDVKTVRTNPHRSDAWNESVYVWNDYTYFGGSSVESIEYKTVAATAEYCNPDYTSYSYDSKSKSWGIDYTKSTGRTNYFQTMPCVHRGTYEQYTTGLDSMTVISPSSSSATAVTVEHYNGSDSWNDYGYDWAVSKSKYTYYEKPIITSVEPQAVSVEGGAWITLNGKNFGKAGVPTVTVNGIKSNCVTRVSDTKVQAMVPAQVSAVTGAEVSILPSTNAGAPETPRTMNITAAGSPKPVVSTVSPSTTGKSGGEVITITGSNFGSTLPGVTVGGQCAKVTENSATSITIEAPSQDTDGAKDVVVYSALGGGTKVGGLTYTSSNGVTLVDPKTVNTTESTKSVTLTGKGFGTSKGTVSVGGTAVVAGNITWTSDTSITFTFTPTTVGANTIEVTPVGATTSYKASIKVAGPDISYVGPTDDTGEVAIRYQSPDADTSGSGETYSVVVGESVKINGSGFGATEGVVKFGSTTVNAANVTWADTTITFVSPSVDAGVYDVTVEPAPSGRATATRVGAVSVQVPATAPVISAITATDFSTNENYTIGQFDQGDSNDSNIFVIHGKGFLGTDNGDSTVVQYLDNCNWNGEGFCEEVLTDIEVISVTDTEITVALPREIEEFYDNGGGYDNEENRHLNVKCVYYIDYNVDCPGFTDFMDIHVFTNVGTANREDGLEYLNLIYPGSTAPPTVTPNYGLCKNGDQAWTQGSGNHSNPGSIVIHDDSDWFGTTAGGSKVYLQIGATHTDITDAVSSWSGTSISLNLDNAAGLSTAVWGNALIGVDVEGDRTGSPGDYDGEYGFACKVQVTPVVSTTTASGNAGTDVSSWMSVDVPGLVLSDTFTSPGTDGGSAFGYRRSDWSGNGLSRGFTKAANLTPLTNYWYYGVRQQWGTFGGVNAGTGGADANNRYIFAEATKASIHLSGLAISPTPVVADEILNHGQLVGALASGSGIDVSSNAGSLTLADGDAVTSVTYKYINTDCLTDPNQRYRSGLPSAVAPATCGGNPAEGVEGTWTIGIASIKIEGGGEDHTSWYVSTLGTDTVKILRRPVTLTPTIAVDTFAYKGQLKADGTNTNSDNDVSFSVGGDPTPADPVTSVVYEYINTACLTELRPSWTQGVPKNVAMSACKAADSTPGTAGTWTIRIKSFKMDDSGTDVASWYTPTKNELVVTINPVTLTVTGTSANKVWDGNDNAKINLEVTGAIAGETPKIDFSGDNAATYSQSDAGADLAITLPNAGAIVLQGDDKWNYTIAPLSAITGTIKKADATIGLATPKTALKFNASDTFVVTETIEDVRGGARPSGWGTEAVVWNSKTSSVCTVDAGTVTQVAAGECIIEASQPATTNYNAAKALSDSTKTTESISIQLITNKTLAVVASDEITDYQTVGEGGYSPSYQMMGLFGDDTFDDVDFEFRRVAGGPADIRDIEGLTANCADPGDTPCTGTYEIVPSGGTGTFDDSTIYTNGNSPKMVKGRLIITALPPSITLVSPPVGPEAGGTTVTVTGERLDTVTSVVIGDVTIRKPNFIVNEAGTQITFTTPSGYGIADITLNAGPASAVDSFTYEAPDEPQIAVTAISDQYGPSTGG